MKSYAKAGPLTRGLVKARTEAQMLATVRILRGSWGTLDPTTGIVGGLRNASVVYQGKARIWNVDGSGILALGEAQIDTRSTFVSIPQDAAPVPRRDDLVVIQDDDLSDTDLDGRVLRVTEVDGGGYIGEARRLTCTSWNPSRMWGEQ